MIKIGRVKITADRWPWQTFSHRWDQKPGKYGWKPLTGLGRFGGGWNWSLGFTASGTTIIFNLLFGSVRISWRKE